MYFVTAKGKVSRAKFTSKAQAVSIAKKLDGIVEDHNGNVVYPAKQDEIDKNPRWILNPRIKREPINIVGTIHGCNNEDYKTSKRPQVIFNDGTKQDYASYVWNLERGDIPNSYYVKHKDFDVNNNSLKNLELRMIGDVNPFEIPNAFIPVRLMKLKKFSECALYHHDGMVHILKTGIDIRGSNDARYPRPIIKERTRQNIYYDLASMCWMQAYDTIVPPFEYIGFADHCPNNLSLDNLIRIQRPYRLEDFLNEYKLTESGEVVFSRWENKIGFPLRLPYQISLSKKLAVQILTDRCWKFHSVV